MNTPWIWMLFVVGIVAVHGNLVPTAVVVHVPTPGNATVHSPPNDPVVIVRMPALRTSAVNDEAVHFDTIWRPLWLVLVNPKSGESSVVSRPSGAQLAAGAVDGIASAHSAIAAVKSKTPFLENFFISMLLVSPDRCRDE
jgi:hypothetical protein